MTTACYQLQKWPENDKRCLWEDHKLLQTAEKREKKRKKGLTFMRESETRETCNSSGLKT